MPVLTHSPTLPYVKLALAITEYVKLVVLDSFDYYYAWMILSLPSYLFHDPIIQVRRPVQELGDSSDEESEIEEFSMLISQVILVFKDESSPYHVYHRQINGLQLKPLISSKGRLFIGHLSRYYPTLETVIFKYTKSNELKVITKVIDVEKCRDLRTGQNCRLGVIF